MYAHAIWNNEELREKAKALGLKHEIEQRAEFYKRDVVHNREEALKQNIIKQYTKDISPDDALELYIMGEEELKKLPSFIIAEGTAKEQVMELRKNAHLYAHIIWNNDILREKAKELGLEQEIKQKAQFFEYDIGRGFVKSRSFGMKY